LKAAPLGVTGSAGRTPTPGAVHRDLAVVAQHRIMPALVAAVAEHDAFPAFSLEYVSLAGPDPMRHLRRRIDVVQFKALPGPTVSASLR
jgi:hypothetical protein